MSKKSLISIMMFGTLGVTWGVYNASALTYQQDVGVSFTFNPSISVTLSSADLIIPNLAPGTASDSNIITVNVKTNNANGYTLNATVGNDTTYNTRDSKNKNNTVTDKFSSVAFGSSIATNTALTDNTWAYSYQDAGAWSNYSGLPLYNDETNIATIKTSNGPAASNDGDDVQFKIAARAANSIASGEYNNVINFVAVANALSTTHRVTLVNSDNYLSSYSGTGDYEAGSTVHIDFQLSYALSNFDFYNGSELIYSRPCTINENGSFEFLMPDNDVEIRIEAGGHCVPE